MMVRHNKSLLLKKFVRTYCQIQSKLLSEPLRFKHQRIRKEIKAGEKQGKFSCFMLLQIYHSCAFFAQFSPLFQVALYSFSTNTTLGQLTGFALNASIDSSLREALDVLWRGSVRHATPQKQQLSLLSKNKKGLTQACRPTFFSVASNPNYFDKKSLNTC